MPRLARSVRHFLEVLDEVNCLHIEFVSFRGEPGHRQPAGRAVVVIVFAVVRWAQEPLLALDRAQAAVRSTNLELRLPGRVEFAEVRSAPAGPPAGDLALVSASPDGKGLQMAALRGAERMQEWPYIQPEHK